jgi:hypothetical protein
MGLKYPDTMMDFFISGMDQSLQKITLDILAHRFALFFTI